MIVYNYANPNKAVSGPSKLRLPTEAELKTDSEDLRRAARLLRTEHSQERRTYRGAQKGFNTGVSRKYFQKARKP